MRERLLLLLSTEEVIKVEPFTTILDVPVYTDVWYIFSLMMILYGLKYVEFSYFNINSSKKRTVHLFGCENY